MRGLRGGEARLSSTPGLGAPCGPLGGPWLSASGSSAVTMRGPAREPDTRGRGAEHVRASAGPRGICSLAASLQRCEAAKHPRITSEENSAANSPKSLSQTAILASPSAELEVPELAEEVQLPESRRVPRFLSVPRRARRILSRRVPRSARCPRRRSTGGAVPNPKLLDFFQEIPLQLYVHLCEDAATLSEASRALYRSPVPFACAVTQRTRQTQECRI